jgi:translation initiation factor IF-3
MFRGREMDRPQFGKRILDRVAEEVAGVGKVEFEPRVDGRNMIMVLAPDKKAQAAASAEAEAESANESALADAASTPPTSSTETTAPAADPSTTQE